ncbi:MAG TPA: sulfurtransferase [Chloroflexota bacterium]|nr:sulfurtransferase [Chloroflexota bacterium]
MIVDADWLAEHAKDANLALVDVRAPFFYAQGHLPGAVNLPTVFLHGPQGPPDPQALARLLGRLGVTRDSHVVAYDDGASPDAARLYWVLTYYDHPQVSVLDGGATAWRHGGRDLEYMPATPEPTTYEIGEPNRPVRANAEQVARAVHDAHAVVLDTRSPGEYLGVQAHPGERAGHVPGAINLDWSNNLTRDADDIARFKERGELEDLYRAIGVEPDKDVYVYCQSGNRASETFLVLRALGYPHVALYSPGYSDWQADPSREIAR